jgi:uncharacterized phage infection (PIP) family protein YhgE
MSNITNEAKYNLIYVAIVLIFSGLIYGIFIKKDNIKYEAVPDAYTQKLENQVKMLTTRQRVRIKTFSKKNKALKSTLVQLRERYSKRIQTLKSTLSTLERGSSSTIQGLKDDNLSLNDELNKLFPELDEAYRKKDVLSDAVKMLSVQAVELADHYAKSHAKLIDTENALKNCRKQKND